MKYYKYIFGIILITSLMTLGCGDGNDGTNANDKTFSSTQNVGSSSNAFLASDEFTSVTIEIDYVEGFKPTQSALNNLKSFLEARLNKPDGITISLDDEIRSPGGSPYSALETSNLERLHRDYYTVGSNLTAYFIVLDGEFEQENVLGFAYYNTSMALLGETIDNNSGGFNQPNKEVVETAVIQHEFGHILGLVNNGTNMVQNHEDQANEAHCNVESCLMYFAVRTSDFMNNLTGGNVPELDAQCIQDLQANGGK
jgi:hypothetical protein